MNRIPDECYRELGAVITYQAIRDFIACRKEPAKRAAIIKQLKSPYMDLISNGLAPILAEKLETNPREVCNRVKQIDKEDTKLLKRQKPNDTFYDDLLMEQQEQM